MMTLFDDEQIYKAVANDIRQETTKEVTRKVTREVTRNNAILMIQKGKITVEEIAEYFPELSEEDRNEIASQVLQQV